MTRRRSPAQSPKYFSAIWIPSSYIFLEVVAKQFPPLGSAGEELDDMCNRRAIPLVDRLDPRRRQNVDDPVEIIIDHVVQQRVDVDPTRRLTADTPHLGTIAHPRDVVIAPTAVLQPNAASGSAVAFESHALGLRSVSSENLRKRHL